jgi:predicted branched-subunit amino acid permease
MFFYRSYYRHPAFVTGFREMLGVAPGIAAWGLMTGVAMVKSGMGVVAAMLMALTVFAGSSQLAAIPLLLAGAPMWVVLATAFCVNLRFVVFSAHMRAFMMHLPRWQRVVFGYFTADLTYVLFVKRYPRPAAQASGRAEQMAYLAGSGSINWFTWVCFSVLGVTLSNFIPAAWGLGFAGILALVGMMCSLAGSRLRWLSAAVAGAAAVLSFGLPLKLNILLAITVSVLVCLLLERHGPGTQTAAAGSEVP